jgi:hypothetical protein
MSNRVDRGPCCRKRSAAGWLSYGEHARHHRPQATPRHNLRHLDRWEEIAGPVSQGSNPVRSDILVESIEFGGSSDAESVDASPESAGCDRFPVVYLKVARSGKRHRWNLRAGPSSSGPDGRAICFCANDGLDIDPPLAQDSLESSVSVLECNPHVAIPLGSPDHGMVDAGGLVKGARDIEGQAMLVDGE